MLRLRLYLSGGNYMFTTRAQTRRIQNEKKWENGKGRDRVLRERAV